MKIIILSNAEVGSNYGVALIERGHEVCWAGGNVEAMLKSLVDWDGCLLLGDEPEFLEFAEHFETIGKKVWRSLPEIPRSASTPPLKF